MPLVTPPGLHALLEAVLQRLAGISDPLSYMQEDCDDLDDFFEQWRYRYAAAIDQR